MSGKYLIEMEGITKIFSGVTANDNITIRLKKGEIHAVLGENSAGKSTLMSILCGLYQPDKGVIKKNGIPVKISGPESAMALGIGMVHQSLSLIDSFTVLDNIILGAEISRFGFTDRKASAKKIKALSERYSFKVDLYKRVSDISVEMKQRTEILKMIYRNAEILIFDEPTAVLSPQEKENFMHRLPASL